METPATPPTPEAEYIILNADALLAINPLLADVYVKLREGHFVRLFKQGDVFGKEDVEKYKVNKGIERFFVKKVDFDASVIAHNKRLEKLASESAINKAEAQKEVAKSMNMVREMVGRSGFTPEAQALAKASVAVTLKVMGSTPKLNDILRDLKKKEGSYITSHSLMVGQIACALAGRIGWNSPGTFFKLSMAAFIHDIALSDDKSAAVYNLKKAEASGKFTAAQIKDIFMHPARASEYTVKFKELPPDVDQIVIQHHESPDGTGFPRGMTAKQISQLSALFIIAHEVVDYSEENPSKTMQDYFVENKSRLDQGNFKKIVKALQASDAEGAEAAPAAVAEAGAQEPGAGSGPQT